jgi:AAA15 family ATPase/GTPase
MLIEFSVENYKSFKDKVVLNFRASENLNAPHLEYPLIKTGVDEETNKELTLLPVIALYGANASGKSNLIEALSDFDDLVARGIPIKNESATERGMQLTHFVADKTLKCSFSVKLLCDKTLYRYEVIVDLKKNLISSEKLSFFNKSLSKDKSRPNEYLPVFTRSASGKVRFVETHHSSVKYTKETLEYTKEELRDLTDFLPPNRTLISMVEQKIGLLEKNFHIKSFYDALAILKFPSRRVDNTYAMTPEGIRPFVSASSPLVKVLNKPKLKKKLLELLKQADFSLCDIQLKKASDTSKDYFLRFVITTPLEETKTKKWTLQLQDQSKGTQVFLSLIAVYLHCIEEKKPFILIIDELEQHLHPALSKEFIKLLIGNNGKGQLFFTSHEVGFMEKALLRPDQCCFVEKDKKTNASHFYRATDFKRIDWNDHKYQVKPLYEDGVLGARPRVYGLHIDDEESV